MSVGIGLFAAAVLEDNWDGFTKECLKNLEFLTELRDSSIHLGIADLALSQRALEVGTAAVKNYMAFATRWFQVDFNRYNFFLMSMSFFHGFETAVGGVASQSVEADRVLALFEAADRSEDEWSPPNVPLRNESKLVNDKEGEGVAIRWTSDPSVPVMSVRDESLLETYPYDNADLVGKRKDRYVDFKQDGIYQKYKARGKMIRSSAARAL